MNSNDVLRRGAACAAFALLLLVPGCGVTPRAGMPERGPEPMLSVDYVLGPVTDAAEFDLDSMERSRDPAAQLRRAWILLQRHRPQEAIDASAAVLYGPDRTSTQSEAFARYIRAASYDALGQHQNGQYDRERARQLALDPRLRERLDGGSPESAKPAPAPLAIEQLTVNPRALWSPAPTIAGRLDPMGRIFRITVHHSAMLFRDTTPATAAGQLRQIQRNHMQQPERRYGDIGYHFLIDPAGRIWQGRDLKWQGAHARSDNNIGNIGICVLGNFVRGSDGQRPTAAELTALQQLVVALSRQYVIAGNQVFCHSDFVSTECPGPYLETEVHRIARAIGRTAARPVAAGRGSGIEEHGAAAHDDTP